MDQLPSQPPDNIPEIPQTSNQPLPVPPTLTDQPTEFPPTPSLPKPQPKIKKIAMIVGVIVSVLILVVVIILAIRGKSSKDSKTSVSDVLQPADVVVTPQAKFVLARYDTDTDGDSYPDFLEQELGFDSNTSELEVCQREVCPDVDLKEGSVTPINVLLILDASGSMGQLTEGKVRMDAAKEAIKDYVNQASQDSNTNVGLMVYGHKGSNSETDKNESCEGIEIIAPVGSLTTETVDGHLSKFSPTGWTSIGGALTKAREEAFIGKDDQNNFAIVISDGIETCDTDPVSSAKSLKESSIKTQVDVIGFAVDATAKDQLKQVAQITGGTYHSAKNAAELKTSLSNWLDNVYQYINRSSCLIYGMLDFFRCYDDKQKQATKLLNIKLDELNGQSADTSAERKRIGELKSSIYQYWKDTRQVEYDQYSSQTEEHSQELEDFLNED